MSECIGKGAFGSVYKAFNWGTGKTVAIKQIKLGDQPKSELKVIMVWTSGLRSLIIEDLLTSNTGRDRSAQESTCETTMATILYDSQVANML